MKIIPAVTAAMLGFATLAAGTPASAHGYYRHHDGGRWHGGHRGYHHGYYGRGYERARWRHHREWRRDRHGYHRGYYGRHW